MKRIICSILLSICIAVNGCIPVQAQEVVPITKEKISILFIGNSLTYLRGHGKDNYFLLYFERMARKAGYQVQISRVTKGGQKLSNWANPGNADGKRAYQAIRKKKWDVVVLQENTDYATAHNSSFQKAAKKLSGVIYKNNPDTRLIYNCTWAYQKGKKISGKFYSYSKMQQLLNQHYRQAAKATGGEISWAGNAFLQCRKQNKNIALYVKDNNHPSRYGSFLSASSMYAAVFGRNPMKSGYCFSGDKKKSRCLQRIAAKVNL